MTIYCIIGCAGRLTAQNGVIIVIDVGAVYDHSVRRYDHHQRTFASTLKEAHPDVPAKSRPDFSTKLSACGLVRAPGSGAHLLRKNVHGQIAIDLIHS
jgi:uncharacterized UPF0160 family protein